MEFKAGMVCKEVRRTATGTVIVLVIYPEEETELEGVGAQLVLNLENRQMEQLGKFEAGKRYGMTLIEHTNLPKVV